MPTNDERREIAAKLRELRVPLRFSPTCSLSEIIHGRDGCASYDSCDKCEADVLRALADLIEPEERTCYIEHVDEDSFHLSCGHEADGYISPNYCPACGARVVYDHA